MPKVSPFDIMREMSSRNLDIRFSHLNNVTNLQRTKGGDTLVTIGVAGDIVAALGVRGQFVGGLIICDKDEYHRVEAELVKLAESPCACCNQVDGHAAECAHLECGQ